ncbi:MAG TPA: alkaline phosphatase family protein [Vicinamibacterales bacterium]|nr:alkaline phosphatase family protein [Vicinamibacterales bacterium]
MRYLRMLSNSVIAAGIASAYLTVLVLHLNPSIPVDPATLFQLGIVFGIAYGANLTVAFYALIVMRQILAVEVLSPGWLSVRLLSWLCTIAAAAAAALMWLNLRGFGDMLDPVTRQRMLAGSALVTAAAIVFMAIGLAHLGRRGGRLSAVILSAAMLVSVVAPVLARGPARQPQGAARAIGTVVDAPPADDARVRLLMLDGASLDVITPAIAEGRLPNIARIFDRGAVLHLATLRPTQAEPVWSAIATGRYPIYNGVRSAVIYRALGGTPIQLLPDYCYMQALVALGFLTEEPQTATDLLARPIWSILSDRGQTVGVIGWPLTQPAPVVNGFAVSDEFHRLPETDLSLDSSPALWPSGLLDLIRSAMQSPPTPDPVSLVTAMGAPQPINDYDVRTDQAPILADRVHLQLLRALESTAPRLLAVRFPGIDAVGHRFLRYADPSAFGDVSERERQQFGAVLSQYYGFVDTLIGRELDQLGANDLLLVVSGFGMEPLTPFKRVLEIVAGNSQISGTHERAPDGFVLAYGAAVAAGRPSRASVVDLAPTILYFLGLPVGRDMDGFARTDLFKPSFTSAKPVTYIPSYGR